MSADAPTGSSAPGVERMADPVTLDDDERELVRLELAQLLPAVQGARRERFAALGSGAAAGAVPSEDVPALQALLELALPTGRARSLYSAEGEKVLTGLYRRTPAGRALASQLGAVNRALTAVAGTELRGARVAMRTPGHFTVTLQTDTATLTLAVRTDSVSVASVAVG